MIAAGRVIKELNKDAKVVFVGPCIAKKAEAKEKDVAGAIDFVLTFEELNNIFESLEIHPRDLKGIPSIEYTSKGGRLYARTGGVSIAVSEAVEELYPDKIKNFKSRKAEGVKECKAVLNEALAGKANASFIEGMGCIGGCVGGPKILVPPEEGKKAVDNFAYDASIKVAVHSKVLDDVLDTSDLRRRCPLMMYHAALPQQKQLRRQLFIVAVDLADHIASIRTRGRSGRFRDLIVAIVGPLFLIDQRPLNVDIFDLPLEDIGIGADLGQLFPLEITQKAESCNAVKM